MARRRRAAKGAGTRSMAWFRELREWLVLTQRTMPARHRALLVGLIGIVASPFTAPVATGAISLVAAVRSVRAWAHGGSGFLRTFGARVAAAARESRLLLPGTVLFLSAAVGAAVSGNLASLAIAFGLLLPSCLAALWFERTWTRDDALHFSHYASLLILPVAAAAVLQIAFFPQAPNGARMAGTFGNPNILAFALETLLPMAMAMAYHVWSRAGRAMLLFSLAVGWIALYFTGCRSGLLAAVAGAVVFLVGMSERRVLTALLALAALFLAALAIGHEAVLEALKPFIPRLWTVDLEIRSRFALWGTAWAEILRDPFLGRGLYSFQRYVTDPRFLDRVHSHSLYLNLWLETGLPGLLAFLWMVGGLAVAILRRLRSSPLRPYLAGGLAAIATLLVHGVTDMPLMNPQTLALFVPTLAALSVALGPRRRGADAAPRGIIS